MIISDRFFQLAGDRWRIVNAIAIHESGCDPLAVGDCGDAQGMFQLHRAFALDYTPSDLPGVVPAGLRGEPFVSIRIMAEFMRRNAKLPTPGLLALFHEGKRGCVEHPGDAAAYAKAVLDISVV